MRRHVRSFTPALVLGTFLSLCGPPAAEAVDGVVLIDQNRALAGSVTPGDAPGFPVTISRAGSYRLSGNLAVTNSDTTAVEITANNVTLDLNGFTIEGPADICAGGIVPSWCFLGAQGVGVLGRTAGSSEALRHNTIVLNGTVRAMGGSGLVLGENARVEKLTVGHNRGNGIIVGLFSTVSENTVARNRNIGIEATGAVIIANVVSHNGATGIFGHRSTVVHNTLGENSPDLDGFILFGIDKNSCVVNATLC